MLCLPGLIHMPNCSSVFKIATHLHTVDHRLSLQAGAVTLNLASSTCVKSTALRIDALALRSSGSSSNFRDLHRFKILCPVDIQRRTEDVCQWYLRRSDAEEWLPFSMAV